MRRSGPARPREPIRRPVALGALALALVSAVALGLWLLREPDVAAPSADRRDEHSATTEVGARAARDEAGGAAIAEALAPDPRQVAARAPAETGTPAPAQPEPGVVEIVRDGYTTRLHHDESGRLTRRDVVRDDGTLMMTTVIGPDGQPVTRGFDTDEDGEVDVWIDHQYDADGLLSTSQVHSSAGAFETEVVFDETGQRLAAETYDEEGRLRGQTLYDEHGNRVGYESYDEDGSLRYRTVDELGPDGVIVQRDQLGPNEQLRERQHYQDGRVARTEWFDDEGNVRRATERHYDADGHSVGSDTYGPDGELIEQRRLELGEHGLPATETTRDAEGRLVERVHYDASGRRRERTERYEDGRLVERSSYDEQGHRESRERLGPDAEVEERTVYDDRVPVVREEYEDGRLARETVFLQNDDGAKLGTETWAIGSDGTRTLTQRCVYDPPCPPRELSCRLDCELL